VALADIRGLVGRTVEQIWVWGPVRLVFALGEDDVYVDFWRCQFLDRADEGVEINVSQAPRESGAILELLGAEVLDASEDDGTLSLAFENGARVQVPPDEHYESWTVGIGGDTVTCLPGGDVSS
jgi:hypothetical protein